MNHFKELYNEIIESITTFQQLPLSNFTKQNILRNQEIILEQKSVLTKPQELFKIVKPIILKLAQTNSTYPVKINIFDAINSDYCKQFQEDGLYIELINLFKDHQDSYFEVKIPEHSISDQYGSFKVPQKFKNFNQETFNYNNLPRIQKIPGIINYKSQQLIQQQNQLRKNAVSTLKRLQIALEIFKKQIFTSNNKNFGTIQISVYQILNNNNQIKPSLDEVISHELQHFLIFLLSIAKTSISFGSFFCNDLKHMNDYLMKPTQFFALSRSYIKILNKVFQKIKDKYSLDQFISQFIKCCISDKDMDDVIFNQFKNVKNFLIIKQFYKDMYKDQHFEIKTTKDYYNPKNMKLQAVKAIQSMKNKRFNTLVKWTIKIMKEMNE